MPCSYYTGTCNTATNQHNYVDITSGWTTAFQAVTGQSTSTTFSNCLQQNEPVGINLLSSTSKVHIDSTTVPFGCNSPTYSNMHTGINSFFVFKQSTNYLHRCVPVPGSNGGSFQPLTKSGLKIHGCPTGSTAGVVRLYQPPAPPASSGGGGSGAGELPASSGGATSHTVDANGNAAPDWSEPGTDTELGQQNSDLQGTTFVPTAPPPQYVCMPADYIATSHSAQTGRVDTPFKTLATYTSDQVDQTHWTFPGNDNSCTNLVVLYGDGIGGNNGYNDFLPVPCVFSNKLNLCVPDMTIPSKACAPPTTGSTFDFYYTPP